MQLKVRVLPGSPERTYPEPHQNGVEQFLEMLRFDQRLNLDELPRPECEFGMISSNSSSTIVLNNPFSGKLLLLIAVTSSNIIGDCSG
jgi:hypothetical protein